MISCLGPDDDAGSCFDVCAAGDVQHAVEEMGPWSRSSTRERTASISGLPRGSSGEVVCLEVP